MKMDICMQRSSIQFSSTWPKDMGQCSSCAHNNSDCIGQDVADYTPVVWLNKSNVDTEKGLRLRTSCSWYTVWTSCQSSNHVYLLLVFQAWLSSSTGCESVEYEVKWFKDILHMKHSTHHKKDMTKKEELSQKYCSTEWLRLLDSTGDGYQT